MGEAADLFDQPPRPFSFALRLFAICLEMPPRGLRFLHLLPFSITSLRNDRRPKPPIYTMNLLQHPNDATKYSKIILFIIKDLRKVKAEIDFSPHLDNAFFVLSWPSFADHEAELFDEFDHGIRVPFTIPQQAVA